MRRLRAVGWLVLAAGLATAASCKGGAGKPCEEQADCAGELLCHAGACQDPQRYCRDAPEHASACTERGRCTLVGSECVAASVEDCKASTRCQHNDRCQLVGPCCARGEVCPSADEDPLTHTARLAEPGRRAEALTKLEALYQSTLSLDGGDRSGRRIAPLLDDITPPLVNALADSSLDAASRGRVLRLLADGRHSAARPALLAALGSHTIDAAPPTPVDQAMGRVLDAVANWKSAEARPAVFRLFETTRASWKKAQAEGFAAALQRAVFALADPSWEKALVAFIERPVDPRGNLQRWLDERYWQRTAAQVLGRLRPAGAVGPLMEVVLSPRKRDVAPAAVDALVQIGKPAAALAAGLVVGQRAASPTPAAGQPDPLGTDSDDAILRTPEAFRISAAAVVLARIGRRDATATVLAGMKRTDALGRGLIALELSSLPAEPAIVKAFQSATETSPLDLPLTEQHHGVAALLSAAPWLFDPSLVLWLVERAEALRGTDTELAPFRDAALAAALQLATKEQLKHIDRLARLVTPDKYVRDLRVAKQLLEQCQADVSCYLGALATKDEDSPGALKAATMAGVFGTTEDRDKIATALQVAKGPLTRRALARALAHLTPDGDAALAKRLEATLDVRALSDPVVGSAIGRLRARAQ